MKLFFYWILVCVFNINFKKSLENTSHMINANANPPTRIVAMLLAIFKNFSDMSAMVNRYRGEISCH